MHSPKTLIRIYQDQGFRITPQRRKIFELLAADETHPTVDTVYQKLKDQMPEVARSTVYNIMHELVDLGELHEVEGLSEGGNRYDKELQPHHHLYCQRCQKLIDINLDDASVMVPDYPALGFKVKRTQVTFYGICSECQTLTVNDDDEYQKRG